MVQAIPAQKPFKQTARGIFDITHPKMNFAGFDSLWNSSIVLAYENCVIKKIFPKLASQKKNLFQEKVFDMYPLP